MPDFTLRRTMMVDTQVRPSDVTKFPIIDAMLRIPREAFVPESLRDLAYLGEDLPLGNGRVLLAPRTFAKMLDALLILPRHLVLDLGCGLGYSTAVMARLAQAVVGVEDPDLAPEAEAALAAQGIDNAIVHAGAPEDGAPRHGPYDIIIIQGGIEVLPEAIAAQLKDGGRIAALFLEGPLGHVRIGVKAGETISWRDEFDATAPVVRGFARAPAFTF